MTNDQIVASLRSLRDYTNATAIVQGDAVEPATNVTLTVNLRDFIFVLDGAINTLENQHAEYEAKEKERKDNS